MSSLLSSVGARKDEMGERNSRVGQTVVDSLMFPLQQLPAWLTDVFSGPSATHSHMY